MSQAYDKDQQALEAVLTRATEDRDFRARLLTDPRRAIEEVFGVVIPPDFRLKFIEREPEVDALIVLPDLRQQPGGPSSDDELSDSELEEVSGGVNTHLTWSRAVARHARRPQS